MHDKIRIDLSTGLMIEIVSPFEFGDDIIETPCLDSFYLPKWDGSQWVEGGQAPEQYIQIPTLEDRLQAAENALLILMGGVL